MPCPKNTRRRRKNPKLPLALLGVLLLGLASLLRPAAQQPAVTPYPIGVAPVLTPLPIQDDPDAPGISREERFRRARVLLQQQQAMSKAYFDAKSRGEAVMTPIPPSLSASVHTAAPATTGTLAGNKATSASVNVGLDLTAPSSPPHATLYLDPAGRTLYKGDKFATQVRLLNNDHLAMDELHLVLAYPAKNLKPVAIHQDALLKYMAGAPRTFINPVAGVLTYAVRLKKPLDGLDIPLLTIVWQGIAPGEGLWILPTSDGDNSAVLWDGQSITDSITGANNTLSGARISVRSEEGDMPQGSRFIEPTLTSMQPLLVGLPNQNLLRKPSLWLGQPPAGTPLHAGQWLTIDIGISNPDHMAFDEIKLAGQYDPDVIALADSDEGNWIGTGANILDGPFHKDWPWDLQFADRIDARRGVFFYHMAMSTYREQPSGVVARVFAQVRQDTTAPVIHWIFDPKANFDQPTTGIYLLGENVLTRGTELAPQEQVGTSVEGLLPGMQQGEKADPKLYRNPQP